jgi:hypothetical protein
MLLHCAEMLYYSVIVSLHYAEIYCYSVTEWLCYSVTECVTALCRDLLC